MSPAWLQSKGATALEVDIDNVPEFVPTFAAPSLTTAESLLLNRPSYALVASHLAEPAPARGRTRRHKSKSPGRQSFVASVTAPHTPGSGEETPEWLEFPPIAPRESKPVAQDDKGLSRSAKRRRRRARKAKEAENTGDNADGADAAEDGIADDESELHDVGGKAGGEDAPDHVADHLQDRAVSALVSSLTTSLAGLSVEQFGCALEGLFPASVGGADANTRTPTGLADSTVTLTGPSTDDFEFEIEPYFADQLRASLQDASPLNASGDRRMEASPSARSLPQDTLADSEHPGFLSALLHERKPPLPTTTGTIRPRTRSISFARNSGRSDTSPGSSPIEIHRTPYNPPSHVGSLSSFQSAPFTPSSHHSLHHGLPRGHSHFTDESAGEETAAWSLGGSLRARPKTLHGSAARRRSLAPSDDTESDDPIDPRTAAALEGVEVPPDVTVDAYPRATFWPGSTGSVVVPRRLWRNGSHVVGDNRNFSVMSYNVLCAQYATSTKFSKTEERHLQWEWRKWRLLEEIAVYGADIVCLQEVSPTEFNSFFFPQLQQLGYDGVFQPKKKQHAMDGCATFYKQHKFQLLVVQAFRYHDISIAEPGGVSETRDSYTRDIALRFNPFDNVALIGVFRNKYTNARLRVVNTHLHWDPNFKDTKLLQACVLMDWLAFYHPEHPLIIAGDLNSCPTDPVLSLMLRGSIPVSEFGDRDFGKFTNGKEHVTHPCKLDEAYRTQGGDLDLPFTNATPDFRGHIDHVLYTPGDLLLRDVLCGVEGGHLEDLASLPDVLFPSDHLSLVCWFREKREPTYRRPNTGSPRLGPASPHLGPTGSPRMGLASPRMVPRSPGMSPRVGAVRSANMGTSLGTSPPPFGLDGPGMMARGWDSRRG